MESVTNHTSADVTGTEQTGSEHGGSLESSVPLRIFSSKKASLLLQVHVFHSESIHFLGAIRRPFLWACVLDVPFSTRYSQF